MSDLAFIKVSGFGCLIFSLGFWFRAVDSGKSDSPRKAPSCSRVQCLRRCSPGFPIGIKIFSFIIMASALK